MNLPRFAIRRPITVAMVCSVAILLGGISFTLLPVDLMPDVEFPTITVVTEYPGVAPEEMETLVTRPIERSISSAPGVEEITATSSEGQSRVQVRFEWGTNLDEAANEIRTRVDRLRSTLPEDAEPPSLFKFDVSQFPILFMAVSGDRDPKDLRQFIEDQILYRLERVPGVAAADVRGGLRREIHVDLSLERLRGYSLSIRDVVDVLRRENLNEPVGPVEEGDFELLLRTQGEFQTVEQIQNIVLTVHDGIPVYVKDVARVEDSHEEIRDVVRVDGRPGIRLSVRKQAGANTVTVARAVKAELERINRDYPDITATPIMDQSEFIEQSIRNVRDAAISGSILAILVLFIFLRNVRSTFVVAASIPIAVISTFALMYFNGFTLNTMSFGGLALGVGMLVDNAIVVLENVFRHRESGRSRYDSAVEGTNEVSSAIVASTLTTIAVFVPLVFLTGMSGIMFQQLAYVIAFALFSSLVVALTVIPVLCSKFLRVGEPDPNRHPILQRIVHQSGEFLTAIDAEYQQLIRWALSHRRTVALGTGLLLAGSLLLAPMVGFELMPETDEGEVRLTLELPAGTRVEVTEAVALEVESMVLREVPEAEHVLTEVGGGGWRESSTHRANIRIQLVDQSRRDRSTQEIANALRPHLVRRPGVLAFARASGGMFLMRMGRGGEDRISVEIRGHDMQIANELALQVKEIVENVPGVTDAQVSRREGMPEMLVTVDRDKAATMGLNVSDLADALRTTVGGRIASMFRQAGNEYNILVRLQEEDRRDLASVEQVPMYTPVGQTVPVSSLVRMQRREGPVNIERKDQERIVTVTANFASRDLGSIMGDIESGIRSLTLPPEFTILFGGEYEEQQKAFRGLMLCLVLAVILVYMVMAAQFESLRDPLVILFSIPLAAIGVILMLFLTDTTFNIQAFIGSIMLAGIVVNNAIVLVDYTNLLRRRDGLPLRHAVELAGRRRLRPILMTTLTTVLAMIPMALGIGEGAEVQAPMARVVIGGLTVSTLITLVLIPTLYTTVEERVAEEQEETEPSAGAEPAAV
ncbi:MAG TPA: efflux RND transporter permease subunit [Vicinamibacteria bacterium]|nr:efflux RND transporter permease subunit [Vicinamibacteria bacterium]